MRKQFHVGDKIICTKNSDIPIYVDEDAGGGEGPSDDLKVTMDSDGKYEEPASLALKTKNERLMNGNMYKIRAFCRYTYMSCQYLNAFTMQYASLSYTVKFHGVDGNCTN